MTATEHDEADWRAASDALGFILEVLDASRENLKASGGMAGHRLEQLDAVRSAARTQLDGGAAGLGLVLVMGYMRLIDPSDQEPDRLTRILEDVIGDCREAAQLMADATETTDPADD
jgi:hypothetical protein